MIDFNAPALYTCIKVTISTRLSVKIADMVFPWQQLTKACQNRRIQAHDMKTTIFEDDREFATSLEHLIRQYTHHPTGINTRDITEITGWINKTSEPVLYRLDIILNDKIAGVQSIAPFYAMFMMVLGTTAITR